MRAAKEGGSQRGVDVTACRPPAPRKLPPDLAAGFAPPGGAADLAQPARHPAAVSWRLACPGMTSVKPGHGA